MSETKEAGMVERVARALARQRVEENTGYPGFFKGDMTPERLERAIDAGWLNFVVQARAAIEAMHDPDDDMIAAAAADLGKPRMHVGHRGSDAVVGTVKAYKAMIQAALARGERLEKALKPFAAWMDALEPEFGDHEDDVIAGGVGDAVVRFGDLREAQAALGFLVPDEERDHGA